MFYRHPREKNFLDVAMAFIVVGAFILTYGIIQWGVNVGNSEVVYNLPSEKIIGGLVVMGLGYIQLQLELIRSRNNK
ncbi:MAG: hypothetical protein WC773_01105 [Patescibacteria group bacterium]|jgi:putative Mn2+ efflux pump MntP